MLSGVEVAGLVLATLPLVIDCLEHYNEGLKPLRDFVKYRQKIIQLALELRKQRRELYGTCERLLAGVVESEEQSAHLLHDPLSPDWKEESLVSKLQERLGGSYTLYFDIIHSLAGTLTQFAHQIGLDGQGKPLWVDNRTHKQYWKRFVSCLNRKEHEALLVQMTSHNQTLRHLTSDNLDLEPVRLRRQNRKASFKIVRDHAARLHNALKARLLCSCSNVHHASLQLEKRECNQSSSFRITFPIEDSSSTTICHEIEIKVSRRIDTGTVASTECPPRDSQITFAHQITAKKLSIASSPSTLMATLESLRSRGKVEKSVKFAITPGVQSAELLYASSQGSQGEGSSQQIKEDQVTVVGKYRIDNLCSQIHATEAEPPKSCIGHFTDDQSQYTVFTLSRYEDGGSDSSNLHDLLSQHQAFALANGSSVPSGVCLSKRARLQLAVTLASTALQLHTTPWLGDDWNGRSIRFRQGSIDQPYISRPFPRTDVPVGQNPNATSCLIRNQCMFGLGVLLLELSIGRPLEHYKDPGQPLTLEDWASITRLVKNLNDEESIGYMTALDACISGNFGPQVRELSLENDTFRQAVYQVVVAPLEEDLSRYHQPSI
ncbi:MAG: hypothetical protein Q9169_005445 [Polycauliona sp. 2 TL-2023]